ncbi:MAG: energy-coupled thiamine transporter ThiT [Lactobacillus sp.]|nr:energy-coupled thiamine transporter ThiT [Lactobacillus sp.]
MGKNKLAVTVEGAIIVALAMALTYIPHSLGISSIEFQYGIIPLIIYAWRRGFSAGVTAGVVWGLLDLILRGMSKGSVINPWQGILEYPVAFGVLGLAGLWAQQIQHHLKNNQQVYWPMLLSGMVAVCAKYLLHFFAGGIVWAAYAPKSLNPWVYSLIINGGSALANIIMVAIVLVLLRQVMGKLVITH